jgi:NAD(P)-dependent dehydrogenase (short-subunit alcohol dehydrogenase family)
MTFSQKVAIVTGASQGIGAGLVQAFRDRNYRVVANSLSIGPSNDPGVLPIAGDVSAAETAERIVGDGLRHFGRIDTLVNNAGIFIAKPFTDYTEADFAKMIATNLAGFFHVTQASIAPMVQQGSGHIVNITASVADQPSSQHPSLLTSLTKGGLNAATKALAIEFAAHGIRVNAVAPGTIKTPTHPAESYAGLEKLVPLGRLGDVEDIVNAVLFLESAPFVSGEILYVDGARSAGL